MGDHGPIEAKHHAIMNGFADVLSDVFPDCTFILFIAPLTGSGAGRVNYISNGERASMISMMKEVLGRFEGQPLHKSGTA